MTTTVSLLAPAAFAQFQVKSGTRYIALASGLITGIAIGDINDLLNGGCTEVPSGFLAVDNLSAAVDPGVSNDTTQGYAPGSIWLNPTNGRVWMCLGNTAGAATWALDGVIPGTGIEPSSMLTQFGSAAFGTAFAAFGEEGNLYRNVGNPVASNGADTTDDILDGFVLPANGFDQAKRGIQLQFAGNFAATANNKKVRIWANPAMSGQAVTGGVISGGTVTGAGSGVMLYDSTAQAGNNSGWNVLLNLYKYGAGNSNTQNYQTEPVFGSTHGGVTKMLQSTLPENAPINFVVTGSSSTTGAAADVSLLLSVANAMN